MLAPAARALRLERAERRGAKCVRERDAFGGEPHEIGHAHRKMLPVEVPALLVA